MFKGFTQIDLFGKAVLFTYKGNSTSKSKVGAICTILLFGFIIWLMVYFGQALFDKSNPQATTFESYNENPSATTLTTDSFVLAIGLADPVSFVNFINESIFTVYASTYKTVRTPQANGSITITYEQIQLEIVSCESEYFGDLADQFTYLSLEQLYCIKPNQTALTYGFPVLEGSFESPSYQSVYIEFAQCDNTTSSVTCGTQNEIDALLRGAYMSLVYSNIAVDLTDSKNPLTQFRDSYYTTVDNHYYKEITMYIQQLEINTDAGFLTTSYETEDYISFGEIREFLSLTPKSSFAYFSMRLSNVETHYNRSYTKLQTVIAQINGIITVAFTALFFILAPYVRLKFYEALINEIFDIKRMKETVNKVLKRNSTQQSGKKPDSKSNNGKKRKSKSKSPTSKQPSYQEDLEQQIPSQKRKDESVINNMSDLMDKKQREFDISVKRRPSLEDSVQENHSPTLSPVARYARQSSTFKDAEPQDKKDKAHYSRFRGLPTPLTISRSESDNKPLYLELTSPLETPNSSKVGILLSARKPNFKQPDFKTLDYEDQGRDQYEDILQNIDHDPMKYKVPIEEYGTSGIRSEERGTEDLNSKENKKTTLRDVWPPETVVSGGEEEKPREENEIKQEVIKGVSLQRLDEILFKTSEKVNLSFGEYLRSWFSKSETIKEKMYILNEGITRINERLDIFNLFKKLREFDKLKVLLMESEQLVLFDSLPKPELALKASDVASTSNLPSRHTIKDAQFIQEKKKKDLILEYYSRLRHKENQTALDRKLMNIYEEIFYVGSRDI